MTKQQTKLEQNLRLSQNGTSNPLEHGGKQIMIKNARTDLQKSRNWALKKACELIKKLPESKDKKVEIG